MKPIENLGHEAHCTGCDCLYPELERLWKREARLEEALQAIHDGIHSDPTPGGIQQVKYGIRQVLTEFKEITPTVSRHGKMIECSCGNKYSRDFLKMKSIPCFNCRTLVKATLMPDEEVAELIIQKRAAEKQASRDQDAKDLKSGKITKQELRERNSYFAVDAEVDFSQDDF